MTRALPWILGLIVAGAHWAHASETDADSPLLLVLVSEPEVARTQAAVGFAVSRLGGLRAEVVAARSHDGVSALVAERSPVAVLVDLPNALAEQMIEARGPSDAPLFLLGEQPPGDRRPDGVFAVGAGRGHALATALEAHRAGIAGRWALARAPGREDGGVLEAMMVAAEMEGVQWVAFSTLAEGSAREWLEVVLSRPSARLAPAVDPWRAVPAIRWGRGTALEVPDFLVLDLWPDDASALVRALRQRTDGVRPVLLPDGRRAVESLSPADGAGALLLARCGEVDTPAMEALLVAFTAVTGDELRPADAVTVDAVRAIHALLDEGSVRRPAAGETVSGPCGTSTWSGAGRLERPAMLLERGADGRWSPWAHDAGASP